MAIWFARSGGSWGGIGAGVGVEGETEGNVEQEVEDGGVAVDEAHGLGTGVESLKEGEEG